MTKYVIVEKQNPLAVHCILDTMAMAERWMAVNAPMYCARGYFMDKTLTPDSFEIVQH